VRFPECMAIPNAEGTFGGTPLAQTWTDIALWEEFLNRHWIAGMIELGTWKGGMGAFLAMQGLARGFRFATVDSNPAWLENRETLERLGAQVFCHDVFDPGFMAELIGTMPKPLLLFCDDGDKRRELREVAPLLSAGDFIAVHDWGSEAGLGDVDPAWLPLMAQECEASESITRYFEVPGNAH
jgi:cephalosporin hydroxylase